jgi:hypothetical protein
MVAVALAVLAPPAAVVVATQLRLPEVTAVVVAVALAVATVAVLALRSGGKSHRRQQPSGRSSPRFIRSLALPFRLRPGRPSFSTVSFQRLGSLRRSHFFSFDSISKPGQYFASQHINRPSAAFRLLFFGSLHYEEQGVTGSYNHPTAHSLIQH